MNNLGNFFFNFNKTKVQKAERKSMKLLRKPKGQETLNLLYFDGNENLENKNMQNPITNPRTITRLSFLLHFPPDLIILILISVGRLGTVKSPYLTNLLRKEKIFYINMYVFYDGKERTCPNYVGVSNAVLSLPNKKKLLKAIKN